MNKIFADTFMMLRNIWMTFHFLDKDMMQKIITTMIRSNPNWNKKQK